MYATDVCWSVSTSWLFLSEYSLLPVRSFELLISGSHPYQELRVCGRTCTWQIRRNEMKFPNCETSRVINSRLFETENKLLYLRPGIWTKNKSQQRIGLWKYNWGKLRKSSMEPVLFLTTVGISCLFQGLDVVWFLFQNITMQINTRIIVQFLFSCIPEGC